MQWHKHAHKTIINKDHKGERERKVNREANEATNWVAKGALSREYTDLYIIKDPFWVLFVPKKTHK